MVNLIPSKQFIKATKKLDNFEREKLAKQIKKIITNTQIGKPLRYTRGERSLYIKPFRLIYAIRGKDIILLKFDHRKRVYDT